MEEKGAKKNTTVNNNQVENLDSVVYNWLAQTSMKLKRLCCKNNRFGTNLIKEIISCLLHFNFILLVKILSTYKLLTVNFPRQLVSYIALVHGAVMLTSSELCIMNFLFTNVRYCFCYSEPQTL